MEPTRLQFRLKLTDGRDLGFRVLRLTNAASESLHLWMLQPLYDSYPTLKSGSNTIGKWILRRQFAWQSLHSQLWPGCPVPTVIRQATTEGAQKGPAELAQFCEAAHVSTSMLFVIMAWAVWEERRPLKQRNEAAMVLASFMNCFVEGNPLLQDGLMLALRSVTRAPVTLHVHRNSTCSTTDLFPAGPETMAFQVKWDAHLRSSGEDASKQWLTRPMQYCTIGELLGMCLLNGGCKEGDIGRGPLPDLTKSLVVQLAGYVDHHLSGKLEPITLDNLVRLRTSGGSYRKRDADFKRLKAGLVSLRKKEEGQSTQAVQSQNKMAIRAHKEELGKWACK